MIVVAGIVAIAAGLLIFSARSTRLPDFDADVKAVGGTLKIDDRFYSGLRNCQCKMSAREVNQLLKRLSPGKPSSGKLGIAEENVMARVDVDLGEGRIAPLTIYWTGHNPAAFSFDGVLYWHDVEVPDFYDEGGRIHADLKTLCEARVLPTSQAPAPNPPKP